MEIQRTFVLLTLLTTSSAFLVKISEHLSTENCQNELQNLEVRFQSHSICFHNLINTVINVIKPSFKLLDAKITVYLSHISCIFLRNEEMTRTNIKSNCIQFILSPGLLMAILFARLEVQCSNFACFRML